MKYERILKPSRAAIYNTMEGVNIPIPEPEIVDIAKWKPSLADGQGEITVKEQYTTEDGRVKERDIQAQLPYINVGGNGIAYVADPDNTYVLTEANGDKSLLTELEVKAGFKKKED